MSNGHGRRVSRHDIQVVQNLIERCLQLYMNQKEVVDTLLAQAKIEPGFTELVWQKLEEENQDFFKAYYLRLMVKHQIVEFNKLLDQQVQLMRQMHPAGVPSVDPPNGSHIQPLNQELVCYVADQSLERENMAARLQIHSNGGSSMHANMSGAHVRTNMGMMHELNGGLIKSEAAVSPFMFGTDGNVRRSIGDASFNTDIALDTENPAASLFGCLSNMPRCFSLSDLAADFSHSTADIMGYPRPPYVGHAENYPESEHQGEVFPS